MKIASPIIVIILFVTVVLTSVYPANNLINIPLIITCVIGLGIITGMFFLYNKIYSRIAKIEPYLYWGLLVALGIALFVVSRTRTDVSAISNTDYVIISYSAGEYADGRYLEAGSFYERYFSYYTNNIRPMILMSWFFRVADFFHISRFYFLLGYSCLVVVATAWAIGYLVTDCNNKQLRLPALLMFGLFLPLWCFTSAYYTDTMSMGLCTIAIALTKMSILQKNNKRLVTICLSMLTAGLICFSMIWKITAVIPIIACILAFFSFENIIKHIKKIILIFISFVLIYASLWIVFQQYDIVKITQNTGDPIISWVAIGMNGNGSWVDSHEYVMELHNLNYTEDKIEFTQQYIMDNVDLFWNPSHLRSKLLFLFADGNLNSSTYTTSADDGSWMWKVYNPYGDYFWRASQYSFVYIEIMYIFMLIGAIISMINVYRGKSVDRLTFSTFLSFAGIFVFLMVWEANSRQLYNQIPMLLLGEMLSIKMIVDFFMKKKKSYNCDMQKSAE